ncbi:hypothetical protein DES41_105490 [Pseudorhodoferax soli]|uniref:Uncharacterized protein n=1 Tax=Pseudorhodoferax soli TaxID=545864 RepID=A0A368XVK1_9BURK|nr:hypothetical protein DES41_105490 [Pseudorhodoferax soli]
MALEPTQGLGRPVAGHEAVVPRVVQTSPDTL